ncbi:MAG: hypothetical protein GWO08_10045, partial [Gammaproteobacteria bacterium]|nr:hypothetical protein [Gammaproteobacteria bacterium]NIR93992.1 hypothetical protein [Gammaproteobacteria bacterium]NIW49220.1 hypothetical protein [Gammaproteobacteria bacterium]NIX59018.1 hypothetical protein [candidate division Zixibacteria bacterium]
WKWNQNNVPFGVSHRFSNKAGNKEQRSDTWQYRGKFTYTNQLTTHHQLKAGTSLKYATFYSDMFWVRAFKNETARNYIWGDNNLYTAGVYLQDRITYEGVVANLGLRADYYKPTGEWPTGYNYSFDNYGTIAPPTEDVLANARQANIWERWQQFDENNADYLQPVETSL